ncbi:hypothetical protein QFZ20_001950 [Flavobacterium sp. W4I14]|nr:hypothetical protein [Flavobacterium sp. W4I14]
MPLPQLPIAWQMVIKLFALALFTAVLKALHFKGHTVEIIKNMRKYFHTGSVKWGNTANQTRFVYAKNYTDFFQQST